MGAMTIPVILFDANQAHKSIALRIKTGCDLCILKECEGTQLTSIIQVALEMGASAVALPTVAMHRIKPSLQSENGPYHIPGSENQYGIDLFSGGPSPSKTGHYFRDVSASKHYWKETIDFEVDRHQGKAAIKLVFPIDLLFWAVSEFPNWYVEGLVDAIKHNKL